MGSVKIKDCRLNSVITCKRTDSILEVAKKLKANKQRHIIVLDKEKPIGIISTTDINNRVVAEERDIKKTQAEEIMSSPLMIRDINDSLAKTYFEMLKENNFSCIITEKDRIKGSLNVKDATDHLVKLKINS